MVLKSVAWVGIYLLGYYDFSIAWLVTPLFLSGMSVIECNCKVLIFDAALQR